MWITCDNRPRGDGNVQKCGGRRLILRLCDGVGGLHSPRRQECRSSISV